MLKDGIKANDYLRDNPIPADTVAHTVHFESCDGMEGKPASIAFDIAANIEADTPITAADPRAFRFEDGLYLTGTDSFGATGLGRETSIEGPEWDAGWQAGRLRGIGEGRAAERHTLEARIADLEARLVYAFEIYYEEHNVPTMTNGRIWAEVREGSPLTRNAHEDLAAITEAAKDVIAWWNLNGHDYQTAEKILTLEALVYPERKNVDAKPQRDAHKDLAALTAAARAFADDWYDDPESGKTCETHSGLRHVLASQDGEVAA